MARDNCMAYIQCISLMKLKFLGMRSNSLLENYKSPTRPLLQTQDFKIGGRSIRRKKNQNSYPYSTNKLYINQDQYIKSLFLNTLRCNHLPTKTKKHKIILLFKSINCCKKNYFHKPKLTFATLIQHLKCLIQQCFWYFVF